MRFLGISIKRNLIGTRENVPKTWPGRTRRRAVDGSPAVLPVSMYVYYSLTSTAIAPV